MNAERSNDRQWLIRFGNMNFSRPLSQKEMVRKIEAGEVSAQDEIAPATGYWFSLKDAEDMREYFGENIRLTSLIPNDAETTSSTSTALLGKTGTKPSLSKKIQASASLQLGTPEAAPQPVIKSSHGDLELGSPDRTRILFGILLVVIFVGTLVLLWMGSQ